MRQPVRPERKGVQHGDLEMAYEVRKVPHLFVLQKPNIFAGKKALKDIYICADTTC